MGEGEVTIRIASGDSGGWGGMGVGMWELRKAMTSDVKINSISNAASGGFIKSSDKPVGSLSSAQKVLLNRKGNVLFNQGDIHNAQRLFITTGYSDGLTRIGDIRQKEGDFLSALKLYILAHNKGKTEYMYKKIAAMVSFYLKDENH